MQLWTMNNKEKFFLAGVTELISYPKLKILRLTILVGEDLRGSLPMLDCVEMWAKKKGATKSIVTGRLGFVKALEPYGYSVLATTIVKELYNMTVH